jgi:hypothetical protein
MEPCIKFKLEQVDHILNEALQKKLYELGFRWANDEGCRIALYALNALNIFVDKQQRLDYNPTDYSNGDEVEILNIPADWFKIEQTVKDFLNPVIRLDGHSYTITKGSGDNLGVIYKGSGIECHVRKDQFVEIFKRAKQYQNSDNRLLLDLGSVDPILSEAVQKKLFRYGYTWGNGSSSISFTDQRYLTIYPCRGEIYHVNNLFSLPYEQKIDVYKEWNKLDDRTLFLIQPKIKVASHNVEFMNDGKIKIGCLTILFETLEKINKLLS